MADESVEKEVTPDLKLLQGMENFHEGHRVKLSPKKQGDVLVEDAIQKATISKANQKLEEKLKEGNI